MSRQYSIRSSQSNGNLADNDNDNDSGVSNCSGLGVISDHFLPAFCTGCKNRQYTRYMTRASGMLMMINMPGSASVYRNEATV
ncbi:hypothetical protein A1355_18870 [Methylomonas koyamae]|uniref:Uncharacterized protein n=1 Tax=Methylomonas koyamae TaxID=702114 RepID=A0A177P8F4_9GAMM|nr:hypothetical protein A1355_18870 [Methylomonas koyamae]